MIRFWGGVLVCLMPVFVVGADNLGVTAAISGGTCTVSGLDRDITFRTVTVQHFAGAGQTSEIKPLQLKIDGCGQLGIGGERAAIQVTGHTSAFDDSLFLDSSSMAHGVGVMLREGRYDGILSDFYNTTFAIKNGDYTFKQEEGQAMKNQTLEYTVGLTTGNGTESVKAGNVKATLLFEFRYH